ncbi:MAG: lasso RiPP family leader peptide-containing protein [Gordonia polyisoprenivorans]|nr:lasso RiPP family leader peptide-containing protein [Gordonia polyisoprenivorans]
MGLTVAYIAPAVVDLGTLHDLTLKTGRGSDDFSEAGSVVAVPS